MSKTFEELADKVEFLNIINSSCLKKKEKEAVLAKLKKSRIGDLSNLLHNSLNGGLALRPSTKELLMDDKNQPFITLLIDPSISRKRKLAALISHPKKVSAWSRSLLTDLHGAIHRGESPKTVKEKKSLKTKTVRSKERPATSPKKRIPKKILDVKRGRKRVGIFKFASVADDNNDADEGKPRNPEPDSDCGSSDGEEVSM
jgi:hypothetical protein